MEIHFQLNYKMPKEVIQAFHITDDTAFETYFENGVLYIRALSEEENKSAFPDECDRDCETCAFSECCPYEEKAAEGSVNSSQFEYCDNVCEECRQKRDCSAVSEDSDDDDLTEDDLAELDCHPEDCEDCEYFCRHCRKCVMDD